MGKVTRAEFDLLRGQVATNGQRMDAIDQGGTRGVSVLASQISDVIKDVSDLRQELKDHDKSHKEQEAQRATSRRWAIMAIIALLTVIETPLIYIATSVH